MKEDDEKLNIDLTVNKKANLSTMLGDFEFNISSSTVNNGIETKSGSIG